MPITHTGNGILPTPHYSFCLNNILHSPSISSNLVSVQKLAQDNHCVIIFDDSNFVIQDKFTKKVLHKGTNIHGLYQFQPSTLSPSESHAYITKTNLESVTLWHNRLCHPSSLKFHHHKQYLKLKSLQYDSLDCVDCCVAKSLRLPFHLSNSTVNKPLSLIHRDVWGPFHSSSIFKYYVIFVDEFSKFTWLYPLTYKSEVYDKFLEFKAYAEKQFETVLKILRTDGGIEYCNAKMKNLISTHGIVHQHSCPYTLPQNGTTERKHRHIIETVVSLLHHSSVPLKF